MPPLPERHRPTTFDGVVGQPQAVALLKRTNPGGTAFLFTGDSGTGKTTLARIVAHSFAEKWHVEEVDAQDVTLDYLRDMEREMRYKGMGQTKTGKAWIVNEVHGLRGAIVSRFLTLLDAVPDHCCILFTTTRRPQTSLFAELDDADPFFSRCLQVPLERHGLASHVPSSVTKQYAEYAMQVAKKEALDGGKGVSAFVQLALECKHNLRNMLGRIQAGAMLNTQAA